MTPIGIENLDKPGLNSMNQPFWDGKRIEIRDRLDLSRLQKAFAVIVSVAAVLDGMVGS